MKKFIALLLTLACMLALVGCGQNEDPTTPTGYPTGKIQQPQIMYNGQVYFYFATGFDEPLPDGYELVGIISAVDNDNEPTEDFHGARVELEQEVYASASNTETVYVKYEKGYARFTIRNSDIAVNQTEETTEDLSEIPGGKRFIIQIRDRAEEEQLPCAEAEELFYEDETAKYYFNVIKSHYIEVTYNNGNSEDIVTALNAGRATIADLDEFGIEYHTEPIVAHTLDCESLQAACADNFIDPSKVSVLGGEWAYTADPNKFVALATVRYTDKDDEYVTAEIVMVGTFGGKTELFHHLNEHSPYTRENALQEFGAIDDRRFPLE